MLKRCCQGVGHFLCKRMRVEGSPLEENEVLFLAEEIWDKVIGYLEKEDRTRLGATCWTLRRIVGDPRYWREDLAKLHRVSCAAFTRLPENAPNDYHWMVFRMYKALEYYGKKRPSAQLLTDITKEVVPHIRYLELSFFQDWVPKQCIQALTQFARAAKKVEVVKCPDQHWHSDSRWSANFITVFIVLLGRASPQLRQVNLQGCDWLKEAEILTICRNCPNLKSLVVDIPPIANYLSPAAIQKINSHQVELFLKF